MILSQEDIIIICNKYLKCIIPGSVKHHPIFNDSRGGLALTKRLYKILRHEKYSFLVQGTSINASLLIDLAKGLLKEHKKVYIHGLNHWFKMKDLLLIEDIIQKYFNK